MAEINDLNVTDASNTARFTENQAPSSVNDGGRALEGILARWHKDNNGSLVSTGSSNAYALAANQTISAYYDGLTFTFETNFANTGAATLNVDSVGAQNIVWPDGSALASGDLPSGAKVSVVYDSDNTQWMLTSVPKRGVIVNLAKVATTSGTLISLSTAVPAWAKKLTVMLVGVSTNGTSNLMIQIGDSGGLETTGYVSQASIISTVVVTSSVSTGFILTGQQLAAGVYSGSVEITLADATTFQWVARGVIGTTAGTTATHTIAGEKALSAALDRISLTTFNGTDTFDAGFAVLQFE